MTAGGFERILLTGAGSGMGASCARILASRGKTLILTGLSRPSWNRQPPDCPAKSGLIHPTLPKAERFVNCSTGRSSASEGSSAVIHCAGIGLIRPLEESTDAEFVKVMNVNVRGTYHVLKEACRVMAPARRGRFATIPGILGIRAMKGASIYCASKHAVTGMVLAAAEEYRRNQLQFSLYHFGGVDTPFWDGIDLKVDRAQMIPASLAARRDLRRSGSSRASGSRADDFFSRPRINCNPFAFVYSLSRNNRRLAWPSSTKPVRGEQFQIRYQWLASRG